jgi:4a-hydroxytetrahydrobiopterin dehydratase
MRPVKLSAAELKTRLAEIPDWTPAKSSPPEAISRIFTFKKSEHHSPFLNALAFVTAISHASEAIDHHPDILIQYNRVTLTLSTHDAGGLTELDITLAKQIDDLYIG